MDSLRNTPRALSNISSQSSIDSLASQCVLCGLCSTTCPTYQESLNENRSPRGRISLIKAIANQELELDDHLLEHLSTCLHCFTCMKVCPSQVNYAELIHYADKELYLSGRTPPLFIRLLHSFLINNKLHRLAKSSLHILYKLKIVSLLKRLGSSRILAYLPNQYKKPNEPAINETKHLLITGCANQLLRPELIDSSINLLKAINLDISILKNEPCCGAIEFRSGIANEAELVEQSLTQTDKTYLSLNSSCTAHLNDYKTNTYFELLDYLFENHWQDLVKLQFKTDKKNILIHNSCSRKNRLKINSLKDKLEQLLPEQIFIEISNFSCCGASGTYSLERPELADKIASPYVSAIKEAEVNIILSTDTSCGLHLKHQLEQSQYAIEMMHPVQFIYQQTIN
ncbi:MAG: (Fe-S)-binding protein [Gammaproteobacteria bacterium]|nr:(Fe-S)-binding protein [Gammaproteobacteria bacterium]